MDLRSIISTVRQNIKEKGDAATPRYFLDNIRKNLISFMCKSDIVEQAKDVSLFGNPAELAEDIVRAINNHIGLAACLGLDIATVFEQRYQPDNCKAGSTSQGTEGQEKKNPATDEGYSGNADVGKGATDGSGKQPGGTEGTKEAKIAEYKKRFAEAKTVEEKDKCWTDITRDKALEGKDKASLQNDKKEAEKRLKQ